MVVTWVRVATSSSRSKLTSSLKKTGDPNKRNFSIRRKGWRPWWSRRAKPGIYPMRKRTTKRSCTCSTTNLGVCSQSNCRISKKTSINYRSRMILSSKTCARRRPAESKSKLKFLRQRSSSRRSKRAEGSLTSSTLKTSGRGIASSVRSLPGRLPVSMSARSSWGINQYLLKKRLASRRAC